MKLTIETLTAEAKKAFDLLSANKFGTKTATYTTLAPIGEAGAQTEVECTMTLQRGGFRRNAKVTTQYKLAGKVIARDALAKLLEPHLGRTYDNPVLLAAFEARAPELAEDYAKLMRGIYDRMAKKYPDGVPVSADLKSGDWHSCFILRDVCDFVKAKKLGGDSTQKLNAEKLKKEADEYGLATARKWFYKTGEKMGHLTQVELSDAGGGFINVTGECRGVRVTLSQNRIINVSPKGKPFHQFPARLYVDGKFITAAAYAKRFKTAEPC